LWEEIRDWRLTVCQPIQNGKYERKEEAGDNESTNIQTFKKAGIA
jgi:hypothetical protein